MMFKEFIVELCSLYCWVVYTENLVFVFRFVWIRTIRLPFQLLFFWVLVT